MLIESREIVAAVRIASAQQPRIVAKVIIIDATDVVGESAVVAPARALARPRARRGLPDASSLAFRAPTRDFALLNSFIIADDDVCGIDKRPRLIRRPPRSFDRSGGVRRVGPRSIGRRGARGTAMTTMVLRSDTTARALDARRRYGSTTSSTKNVKPRRQASADKPPGQCTQATPRRATSSMFSRSLSKNNISA